MIRIGDKRDVSLMRLEGEVYSIIALLIEFRWGSDILVRNMTDQLIVSNHFNWVLALLNLYQIGNSKCHFISTCLLLRSSSLQKLV